LARPDLIVMPSASDNSLGREPSEGRIALDDFSQATGVLAPFCRGALWNSWTTLRGFAMAGHIGPCHAGAVFIRMPSCAAPIQNTAPSRRSGVVRT
jgi:hypothetical protein